LKQLASLKRQKISSGKKITKSSPIFKTIIEAIKEKKGENIVSLDLSKITEAVSDYFIICEATNPPQIRAIAENIVEKVKENCDENVFHKEGIQQLQWVLLDYVNVVVHVMLPESRNFYSLEEMWHDAAVKTYTN
jgi:ribosome-associated protein